MWLLIALAVVALAVLIGLYKQSLILEGQEKWQSRSSQNAELVSVLLNLEYEPREELFKLYREQFGVNAARYARDTYLKWKAGVVKPNKETFRRFMHHLPRVMSFDLKCEVLRELREAYCLRDNYTLSVYTDEWKEQLLPLIETVIRKTREAELPQSIKNRLVWLAEDDVEIANAILAHSQEKQSLFALTLLDAEFKNIEHLLNNARGARKVTHELKLPMGTITMNIKRR